MLQLASILETLMVVCFGVSWPINLTKALKSRSTKGISIIFYYLVLFGYLLGIAGKVFQIAAYAPAPWYETVKWYVLFFYVLNTVMVLACIIVYFRNKRLEKNA
ncbi:MAG: hypothetical protein IKX91_02175 [Firmicutes bacterium]|nr:hypothetical protein [Bacillota bacterium]